MNRGDIVWHKFKEPDKKRPVLILTRDGAISELNSITVIPTTSNVRDLPSQVVLTEGDGMPKNLCSKPRLDSNCTKESVRFADHTAG